MYKSIQEPNKCHKTTIRTKSCNLNVFVLLFVAKFYLDRTYFAHVKKCRKCHHPMEKSGGCQHMQCRCGFQFCWECLSAWQDHGPYLTCPTTHIKLTVTAVILLTCSIYCFFNKFYLFFVLSKPFMSFYVL